MNIDAYDYYNSKFYSSLFLRDVYDEIIRYNTETIINIFIKEVAINCMVYKYSLFKLEKMLKLFH